MENLNNIIKERLEYHSHRNPIFFANDILRSVLKEAIIEIVEEKIDTGFLLGDKRVKINDVCLSGFSISKYYKEDDDIEISLFLSLDIQSKNIEIYNSLLSTIKNIFYLYKNKTSHLVNKNVEINIYHKYKECSSLDLYSVINNKWIRRFDIEVSDDYKKGISVEYSNINDLSEGLYEKHEFLPVNKHNLKKLESFYFQYYKQNNSDDLLKKQVFDYLHKIYKIKDSFEEYLISYNSRHFAQVADEMVKKDKALIYQLNKYYDEKDNTKKDNRNINDNLEEITDELIEAKDVDCPILFNKGKLRKTVRDLLNIFIDDFLETLEIDRKHIKDVQISSSIVSRHYNNDSDIDLKVIFDFESIDLNGFCSLVHGLKHKNKFDFKKKYFLFDKFIDISTIPNQSYSFSNNIYSIWKDEWLLKTLVEEYKYDKYEIIENVNFAKNYLEKIKAYYKKIKINKQSLLDSIDLHNILFKNLAFYDLFYGHELKKYEKTNHRLVDKILKRYFPADVPIENFATIYSSFLNEKLEKIISKDLELCKLLNMKPKKRELLSNIEYMNQAGSFISKLTNNNRLSNLLFDNNEKLYPEVRKILSELFIPFENHFKNNLDGYFEITDICLEGDYASYSYEIFSSIDIVIYVKYPDIASDFNEYIDDFFYGFRPNFSLLNKKINYRFVTSGEGVAGNSYSVYQDKWIKKIDYNRLNREAIFNLVKSKVIKIEELKLKTSISVFKEEYLEEIWSLIRSFYSQKFNSFEEEIAFYIVKKIKLVDYAKNLFDNYHRRKSRELFVDTVYPNIEYYRREDRFRQFIDENPVSTRNMTDDEVFEHLKTTEYQFRDKLNPLFFDDNEVLNEEIRQYLLNIANGVYKYSPFNKKKIKIVDICICSGQTGKYYKDSSDIDLHIYIDTVDDEFKDKLSLIPNLFLLPHCAKYFRGYSLLSKGIDVSFAPPGNVNISSNSYSLIRNEWNRKTEKSEINLDFEKLKSDFDDFVNEYKAKDEDYKNLLVDNLIDIHGATVNPKYLYTDGNYKKTDYETSNTRLYFKLIRTCGYVKNIRDLIQKTFDYHNSSKEVNLLLDNSSYLEITYSKFVNSNYQNLDKKLNNDYSMEILNNSKDIDSYIREYLKIYFEDGLLVNDVCVIGDFTTKYYDENSQLDLYIDVKYNDSSRLGIFKISYMLQSFNFISIFSKYKILGKSFNIYFNENILENENIYSLTRNEWVKKSDDKKSQLKRRFIYNLSPMPLDFKGRAIEDMLSKVNDVKPLRNPILFNEDNLVSSIADKLKNIGLECFNKLKSELDFIELSDIVLSGSLASFTYNSNSDLDVHVVLKMQSFSDEEITKFIKIFNNKTDVYNFLGCKVDIVFKFDVQTNFSASEYSLLNNNWVRKAEKNDYTYSLDNIRAMLNKKLYDFDSLKNNVLSGNKNIYDLVEFRNSSLITHNFYVSEKLTTEKNIDLTDYKKYSHILKKIGFVFEIEDEISDILNKKYF